MKCIAVMGSRVRPLAVEFNDQRRGNQTQGGSSHPYAASGLLANTTYVYKPSLFPHRSLFPGAKTRSHFHFTTGEKKKKRNKKR